MDVSLIETSLDIILRDLGLDPMKVRKSQRDAVRSVLREVYREGYYKATDQN